MMVKTRKQQLHAAALLNNTNTQKATFTRAAQKVPQRHLNSKERSPAPIRIHYEYSDSDDEEEVAMKQEEMTKLEETLKAHKMYYNQRKNMPKHLETLRILIQQSSRAGPPSPKSQQVARANEYTSRMPELDALIHLEDYLGYMPASALNGQGEKGIFRIHSQVWNATSVPRPNTEHDNILEAILQSLGCPPKPKPDIAYGYTRSSFSAYEMTQLLQLSRLTRVTDSEPLFPFLIFEWKSRQGDPIHGKLQAMRDGAAAVNTLRQFFIETGTKQPREHETAVFVVCVDAGAIEIFVSWRRDDPEEGVSWEMDSLYQGFLQQDDMVFQARSILLIILDWARRERLRRIKAALGLSKRGPAVEDESPPCKKQEIW